MSIKLPNVLNALTNTELKSLISHPQIKTPQMLFYNAEVINIYIYFYNHFKKLEGNPHSSLAVNLQQFSLSSKYVKQTHIIYFPHLKSLLPDKQTDRLIHTDHYSPNWTSEKKLGLLCYHP